MRMSNLTIRNLEDDIEERLSMRATTWQAIQPARGG